ncbi:MAG: hypothetical protein ABR907_10530 [Terracidiphilus sp.]|jgi:hypothetical protein
MHTIAELNVLVHARTELPRGFDLETEEFREGWRFASGVNASQIKQTLDAHQWSFIKVSDKLQAYGLGDHPQEAISSALRLAVLRPSANFHALELEQIELTQYPWFYLAKIKVCGYRIQQSAVPCDLDNALPATTEVQRSRLSVDANLPHKSFGSDMPLLKRILTQSKAGPTG